MSGNALEHYLKFDHHFSNLPFGGIWVLNVVLLQVFFFSWNFVSNVYVEFVLNLFVRRGLWREGSVLSWSGSASYLISRFVGLSETFLPVNYPAKLASRQPGVSIFVSLGSQGFGCFLLLVFV